MAYDSLGRISVDAAAAATLVHRFVKQTSSGLAAAGAGEYAIGVGCESPAAANDAVAVQVHGIAKVVAGGTIAKGAEVSAGAAGVAVDSATSGHVILGTAMQAAVSGDVFEVLLAYRGAVA